MKIGGGGRETWMVLLPMSGLVLVVSLLLGGPEQALIAAEHLVYDTWTTVSVWFRR